jgi:hypothetical protein
MNNSAHQHDLDRRPPFRRRSRAAKERAKFRSRKIRRNPLKSLDSDERIQGNPSLSNPPKRGLSRSKGQEPRTAKSTGRPRGAPYAFFLRSWSRSSFAARAFGRAALHYSLALDRPGLAGEDAPCPRFLRSVERSAPLRPSGRNGRTFPWQNQNHSVARSHGRNRRPGPQLGHERPWLFDNLTDHHLGVSRKGGRLFLILVAVTL